VMPLCSTKRGMPRCSHAQMMAATACCMTWSRGPPRTGPMRLTMASAPARACVRGAGIGGVRGAWLDAGGAEASGRTGVPPP
jgi:hypothetical protein